MKNTDDASTGCGIKSTENENAQKRQERDERGENSIVPQNLDDEDHTDIAEDTEGS